ncbi:MAG: hypothetical protein K9L61_00855, partial [Candidatus Omnitrophica bacterium]|nr:hypothetical protein [Candidatus Omnitrophota bacterium]
YSKASKKEYIHITSGSTGVPIKIIVSNVAEAYRRAQQLRFYSWWGIHPYDKNVLIWGRLQKDKQKSGIKKIIKTKIGLSSYFIDVFTLSSFIIRKYFFDIKKLQPKFIRGYTSGIFRFCNLIENEGLDAKKLGIKVAIVTSEILFPGHREYIQNILGCPVANEYGSSETGLIAYDCKYQQMHLCEETAMVLMDKKGKMLVSDLYNLSTPLINYEIGDKIILSEEKCKCGRESRIIKIIKGREGDEVKTIDGRFLSSHIFTYIFKDLNKTESPRAIKQYKVYQKGTFFDLYIVKDKNFSLKTINYVVDRMEKAIGRGIKVNIHYVDEIKREKSGKLRHFVREG